MLKAGKLGRLALGQFSGEGIQVCNAMLVSCLLAVKQKLLIIGKKKKKTFKCATPNHTLLTGKAHILLVNLDGICCMLSILSFLYKLQE